MTDELPIPEGSPPPSRAAVRAARKARRAKRIERREACFELLASGYSHQQIAEAMKVSVASVRRAIARAIEERRLDAPERYIHFQVARLTRALRSADDLVERGDMKAAATHAPIPR